MLAYGFTVDVLAGLVRAGLAAATPQRIRAGGKVIEVVGVRITDEGKKAVSN